MLTATCRRCEIVQSLLEMSQCCICAYQHEAQTIASLCQMQVLVPRYNEIKPTWACGDSHTVSTQSWTHVAEPHLKRSGQPLSCVLARELASLPAEVAAWLAMLPQLPCGFACPAEERNWLNAPACLTVSSSLAAAAVSSSRASHLLLCTFILISTQHAQKRCVITWRELQEGRRVGGLCHHRMKCHSVWQTHTCT